MLCKIWVKLRFKPWEAVEMDSMDLLAREDEFKKLNKQLEKKTESLMKEIEHVMHKQDIFSEFASSSLTLSPVYSTKKHHCSAPKPITSLPTQHRSIISKKKTKNSSLESNNLSQITSFENEAPKTENETQKNCDVVMYHSTNIDYATGSRIVCECMNRKSRINEDLEFMYAFVSVNVKDKVLPQSFLKDRVTVENVCKFLSSKVKLMQEQIDQMQNTIEKRAKQCQSHLTQLAELESERMSLLNKTNNMKSSTAEMRAKCGVLQNKLDEKERLYKEQRSESDKLSSEVKRLKTRNVSIEAKSAAQQETIDNLRQQIENVKQAEKEFRDSARNLSASHQNAIARLEAQIKALNTHNEKQTALIDNLRRQNVLLSTEGALKALEKDYSDFLNQDFE